MTSETIKSQKVEYLCTINSDGDFCTTKASFCSLLESYEKLKIENNKLFWDDKEFQFELYDGTVLNSTHKFFHLKLINSTFENKNEFLSALKVIRTILSKVNNNQPPEILWDDISSEYAIQAYPVIHELENLMRKLITKFMITKVGLSWTKDNIPKEVSESIKNANSNKRQNYIYDTDFIQLSNFLFKDYTVARVEEFIEKIKKANEVSDLNLDELKKIVPQSNWTRYFNPIVDCTSEELSSKWDKLYRLRCKVAHNNFMEEEDFNNLLKTSDSVKSIIQDAIKNLDKVNINEEDKEDLAESAAINLNKMYGDFVVKWKVVLEILNTFILRNNKNYFSDNEVLNLILKKGYINEDEYKNFHELRTIRNLIVHDSNFEISEMSLNSALKDLAVWEKKLLNIGSLIGKLSSVYEISRSSDGQYRFVFKAPNGEILLTSELFKAKASAINALESLKINSKYLENFEILTSKNEKKYFNIKSKNHHILATSQFYNDEVSLDLGMKLVLNHSQTEKIIDLSI